MLPHWLPELDLCARKIKISLECLTHVRFNSYMRKTNKDVPTISDAEWVLMRVIWAKGQATANEVVKALEGQQEWKPKTIHTLLRRLTDKEVLGRTKSGREYIFHALVDKDQAESAHSQSFISSVFEGHSVPFLARFLEDEKLSSEEIAKLKEILDRRSK